MKSFQNTHPLLSLAIALIIFRLTTGCCELGLACEVEEEDKVGPLIDLLLQRRNVSYLPTDPDNDSSFSGSGGEVLLVENTGSFSIGLNVSERRFVFFPFHQYGGSPGAGQTDGEFFVHPEPAVQHHFR